MRIPGLAVVALVAAAAHAAPFTHIERDVAYGHDPLQTLDLETPEAKAFATVVFVHGGSLSSGDKQDDDYGKVCPALVAEGIGCTSVNYRLAPKAAWPAPAEDVASAVAWVKAHIEERDGDPRKIFLMGHSSGAMLVALVAAEARWLGAHRIDAKELGGVIAMGSIMWDDELDKAIQQHGRPRVEAAFKKDPDNAMFGSLDAYLDHWPIRHLHAGLPPYLFLIAEAEQEQPPVLMTNKKFVDDTRALGNGAEYRVLPGLTHMTAIRKFSEPGDRTMKIVRDFVRKRPSMP
ncbi:MAG TPA: alpha/beta hydrolase [Candidatus Polarisedimenticolaceae bacterium]|nr:alpha/beta hydrolase [Candidatus Polarisedimenticolaceae bacterium]